MSAQHTHLMGTHKHTHIIETFTLAWCFPLNVTHVHVLVNTQSHSLHTTHPAHAHTHTHTYSLMICSPLQFNASHILYPTTHLDVKPKTFPQCLTHYNIYYFTHCTLYTHGTVTHNHAHTSITCNPLQTHQHTMFFPPKRHTFDQKKRPDTPKTNRNIFYFHIMHRNHVTRTHTSRTNVNNIQSPSNTSTYYIFPTQMTYFRAKKLAGYSQNPSQYILCSHLAPQPCHPHTQFTHKRQKHTIPFQHINILYISHPNEILSSQKTGRILPKHIKIYIIFT